MERLSSIFIAISLMLMIINIDTGMAAAAPLTLHVYTQFMKRGPNGASGYAVANASITSESPTHFGRVGVFDEKVTAGPELDSAEVGHKQGLLAYADTQLMAASHFSTFVFTSGVEYSGSSITVVGRNVVGANGELAVVGGTGAFRYARGYAITSAYMNTEDRMVTENWIHLV